MLARNEYLAAENRILKAQLKGRVALGYDETAGVVARDLLSQRLPPAMGGVHKVEGNAHLKVDLNGFPKGTRTDLTYGGLFTQYTLRKGLQMEEGELK